jgi:hypothetical protein
MTALCAEDSVLGNDEGSTSVCMHAHTCNPPREHPGLKALRSAW